MGSIQQYPGKDLGALCERVACPDQLSILPAGLPWLVPRLKHAKVLRITSSSTFDTLAVRLPQNEIASRLQRASCDLPGLQVLVRQTPQMRSLLHDAASWKIARQQCSIARRMKAAEHMGC